MSLAEEVRGCVLEHADRVLPCLGLEPRHSAVLPSEMLAFCCLCLGRGVQTVVESGRKWGYSTEVLSGVGWTVVSLETVPEEGWDARLHGRGNLLMLHGDGELFVRNCVPVELPSGLLLDGPKGDVAYRLAMEVRGRYAVIGIHDAHPGSVLRERVEGMAYLTSDEWLLERYGYLDEAHLRHCGYGSHSELLATSSTLALF